MSAGGRDGGGDTRITVGFVRSIVGMAVGIGGVAVVGAVVAGTVCVCGGVTTGGGTRVAIVRESGVGHGLRHGLQARSSHRVAACT